MAGEPAGLNPVITTASPELNTGCIVYEGLVILNVRTSKFEPLLAKVMVDRPRIGPAYTFKLRKTNWHDGAPFTSEDVRYTLMEVASKIGPVFAAQAGKLIENVERRTPRPRWSGSGSLMVRCS